MRFSAIFSVLVASAMASAGVVPKMIAKRTPAEVQEVITKVSDESEPILSKFDSCGGNDECLSGLVGQLVTQLGTCPPNIEPLSCDAPDDGLTNAVANLKTRFADSIDPFRSEYSEDHPLFITALANLDTTLSECLKAASNQCPGLEQKVATKLGGETTDPKNPGTDNTPNPGKVA